jgi:hypothetical protein
LENQCWKCPFIDDCESESQCLLEYINKKNINIKDKKPKVKKYSKERQSKEE